MLYKLQSAHSSDWFTIKDLEEVLGYRMGFRVNRTLEGIILSKKEITGEQKYFINKKNVWGLAQMPGEGRAKKEDYVTLANSLALNKLTRCRCIGEPDVDFYLKFGPFQADAFIDAFYVRAWRKGLEASPDKILVCADDILRLALCKNFAVTQELFERHIQPRIIEKKSDQTGSLPLEKMYKARNTAWELKRFLYNDVYHYHLHLFGGRTAFMPHVRGYFGFDSTLQTSSESFTNLSGQLDDKFGHASYIRNPSWLMQEGVYAAIETSSKRDRKPITFLICGREEELEAANLTLFTHQTFGAYNNYAHVRYIFLDTGNPKADFRRMKKDATVVTLCESAYPLYNEENFGSLNNSFSGIVLFTDMHSIPEQSRTEHLRLDGIQQIPNTTPMYVNKFYSIHMVDLVNKLHDAFLDNHRTNRVEP
jgi:hypothetical protein